MLSSFPRLTAALESGRDRGLHIGAQLYIAHQGKVLLDTGWGLTREGVPMESNTLMVWLSSTKPLAAIALSQVLPRKNLSFDLRVSELWPEFGQKGKEGITLRHLLTHTAGFRSADSMWSKMSWEENLRSAAEAPLEDGWILGKQAGYHMSISWFVLAEIVRRLDGRDYATYVREEIFLPLNLQDAYLQTDESTYHAYGDRIGLMHNTLQGRCEPHSFWDTVLGYTILRPGSSGHGPIRSLGKIYECLLNGGDPLLPKSAVEEITKRHRVGLFDETFQHTIDWGLGFVINSAQYGRDTVPYGYGRHASPETFGHSGAQSSSAFADPEHHLVVAWVLNGMCGESLHRPRAREINTAIYEDLGITI